VTARITLTADVSAFVSDNATTDAVPTVFPVTVVVAPLAGETEAIAPAVLVQLTTRSVTTVPRTSFTVADIVSVFAGGDVVIESLERTMDTDPTGAFVATTVFAPLLPSLVAVIVAVPAATPLTNPVESIDATVGLFDCQVTTRPVSTFPAESFVTAASFVV
jgi:hypothetical protein